MHLEQLLLVCGHISRCRLFADDLIVTLKGLSKLSETNFCTSDRIIQNWCALLNFYFFSSVYIVRLVAMVFLFSFRRQRIGVYLEAELQPPSQWRIQEDGSVDGQTSDFWRTATNHIQAELRWCNTRWDHRHRGRYDSRGCWSQEVERLGKCNYLRSRGRW